MERCRAQGTIRLLQPPWEQSTTRLRRIVDRLVDVHGQPAAVCGDPFELILEENVAYLADDASRAEAMARLRRVVGTTPDAILDAGDEQLAEATKLGILSEDSARKLREAAEIASREFGGDLASVLDLPVDRARRVLRRFPGIGEPGAEKILLYCRRHPSLAPESNGLRVLTRLGLIPSDRPYATTYRAARDLGRRDLGDDFDELIAARHALRKHGRVTCRRSAPRCDECVVSALCTFPSKNHEEEER